MYVAVEVRSHVKCWLDIPYLQKTDGSETTVVETPYRTDWIKSKNAPFKVFFPEVAIDDVRCLRKLRIVQKYDYSRQSLVYPTPSCNKGWLIIIGYGPDGTIFTARFYSKELYSQKCAAKAKQEDETRRRRCEEEEVRRKEEERRKLNEMSAKDCYQKANEYYEHGDFAKAIEFYSEAIIKTDESDPDLHKYYYNRGLAFCCLDPPCYSEGKRDLLKVLELKPNFAEGCYILGLAKEYLNDLDGAKEAYEKALSLDPDFKDARNRKELLESKKRKHHSGLISKASSTSGNFNEHAATLEQIEALMKEGDLEEALKLVERILRQDPDDFQLLLRRRVIIGQITARSKPDALCGLPDVRDMIDRLIVSRIKNWNHPLYRARIAQTSVGIILHGPPGCGKTTMIFSAAKDAGIEVVEIVMSEILNMWSGESEKRLSELFETAKDAAKVGKFVIILVDELDSLGLARSVTIDAGESSWSRDLRNTFRRLFNDMQGIPNVAVVGLTNCLWAVDQALRRPGRLGASIVYVPPPDTKTREEIFRLYSQETPGYETLNFEKLARITEWFSGDDIRSVCRDVHLEIARRTIQVGDQRVVATVGDYERFIQKIVPTALGWVQNVAKAWIEGKIEDREIDKRLMADIKATYLNFEGEKNSKKPQEEFEDHRPTYVK